MKTPLSMIENDPQKYLEEWFNVAVPNGKEFSLPNVSNPILDLPMTNFSLGDNPQNALLCQLGHFSCSNIRRRRPKYRPIPNARALPNIPYHQIHGVLIPIIPKTPQSLFNNGRLNTPLNFSAARNDHRATNPTAYVKIKPKVVQNNTTNPYAPISVFSLSSLLEQRAKLESLNRAFSSQLIIAQNNHFALSAAPDLYRYNLTRANRRPYQDVPPFAGNNDHHDDPIREVNNIMKLLEAANAEARQGCHRCQQCGAAFLSAKALGGHVSAHARKRKRGLANTYNYYSFGDNNALSFSDDGGPAAESDNDADGSTATSGGGLDNN